MLITDGSALPGDTPTLTVFVPVSERHHSGESTADIRTGEGYFRDFPADLDPA